MTPFAEFPAAAARRIRFVLTDVDDTLTDGPRLPAVTYGAIERLSLAGVTVIPVTAAPAGWCDLIARMWPVGAVIGENGGLCFCYRHGVAERHYWAALAEREAARTRLQALAADIAGEIAADQRYRETTLAFVNRDPAESEAIMARLTAAGARATVNSLWVVGWFGDFDKLAMTGRMMAELFTLDINRDGDSCLYVGDSPNDAPMFDFFANSVGVASVGRYAMPAWPLWITMGAGGAGFVEVADRLLTRR